MNRAFLGMLALASNLFAAEQPQVAAGVRETDAVCARCHSRIYQSYLKTRMANASGPALEGLVSGTFQHVPSGVEYRISLENDAVWLSYSRTGDNPLNGRQKLLYFLGSGNHGRTYLYPVNGHWFETPIAYYARKQGYDIRPAYLDDRQMPLDLPVSASCLRCHMSDTRKEDAGTRSHYTGLPFLHTGVTCESCHGETAAHVASAGTAKVIDPDKLTAERRDSICISCHLEGDVSVEHRGKSLNDYRPGDSVFDYVSYFVSAEGVTSSRAVSQVEALNLSACKRASGPRMSCSSCHDSHFSPPTEKKAAYYRTKCLVCHSGPKFAAHFAAQPDCTACHMPKGAASDIPHEQWTDHRILRQPPPAQAGQPVRPQPAFASAKTLVAPAGIPSLADDRSLGMAYYNLVSQGDASFNDKARVLLESSLAHSPTDSAVLVALGVLTEWKGQQQEAYRFYLSALQQNVNEYTAKVNAGVLLARSGKLELAAKLWQPAFDRNEDLSDLGLNLASARCLLGDRAAALEILRRVLIYNPDYPAARSQRAALESGKQACRVP